MRKKIIFIFICLLSIGVFSAHAQEKSGGETVENISFAKALDLGKMDSVAIYKQLKNWFEINITGPKQYDETHFSMAGIGYRPYMPTAPYTDYRGVISYGLAAKVESNKIILVISYFVHSSSDDKHNLDVLTKSSHAKSNTNLDNQVWKDLKDQAADIANELIGNIGTIQLGEYKYDPNGN